MGLAEVSIRTNVTLPALADFANAGFFGIYDGGPIFRVLRDQRQRNLIITQSEKVKRDVGWGDKRSVYCYIKSLNANRVVSALDAGNQAFIRTHDVRHALLECAIEADNVNEDIGNAVPASDCCSCSPEMALLTLHPCGLCLGLCLCSRRGWSLLANILVCPECLARETAQGQQSDGRVRVKLGLRLRMISECRSADEDYDSLANQNVYKDALDDMFEKAFAGLPSGTGWAYRNGYAAANAPPHRYGMEGAEGLAAKSTWNDARRDPHSPSCDASLPYAMILIDGVETYRVHCRGNCEVIPEVVNTAKYTHLPGAVHEIAEYARLPEPHTAAQRLALYDKLTDLYKIRMKSHKKRAVRMVQEYNAAKLAQDHDEMISGTLISDAPEEYYGQLFRYNIRSMAADEDAEDWPDENGWHAARRRICREIRAKFKTKLIFADDGAPWFGPGPMPDGWSFGRWKVLCRQRFERMRRVCNRHHEGESDPSCLDWHVC